MIKALALNTEDPVFSDQVARDTLYETFIGQLKQADKRAKAVKEFHDIATLFNSLSSVLDTVDIQYIELEARHEPIGFFSFAGFMKMTTSEVYRGHGRVLSYELRSGVEFFKDHDDPRFTNAIESLPWYNSLDKMVFVFNGLLGVYLARIDKITDLAKHAQNPKEPLKGSKNPYSRIPEELQECRDRIEQYAKSLEEFLQGYLSDFTLRAPLQRKIMNQSGASVLTGEIFQAYSRVTRLLAAFRALSQGEVSAIPVSVEEPQPVSVEEPQPVSVEEPVRIIEAKKFHKPMSKALTVYGVPDKNKRITIYGVPDENKRVVVYGASSKSKDLVVYREPTSIAPLAPEERAPVVTPLVMAGIGAVAVAGAVVLLNR